MHLSIVLALSAISSFATADMGYAFLETNCQGNAAIFKDLDHQTCALSITGPAANVTDAINKGLTTVKSFMLEVQETGSKQILAWGPHKIETDPVPLQCGALIASKRVKRRKTCVNVTATGYSWVEKGNGIPKRSNDYACTSSTKHDAVFIGNKYYALPKNNKADAQKLQSLLFDSNAKVEKPLAQYEFVPSF
ncbi:hypothetical protein LEMA_P113200.1 [Plenodomus lingam JN3]|uniref:Uncharacterized protein n=1 Tax=Leptosphaeria maculans (strain JN3 / isolate v23.1.3 / race Av1-4-5-6-7-8) TaxID=985895 RepID=E4ZUW8_LEPMJ|nr:hypothetical protein LEMA_P113200.1 [Plenodomus lingam JN3]CBX94905.1 hypothetical protein LEMA_P113200.1 [Plenodomus lingam JN3]